MNKRKPKAFTLIEILVVIAVIGLLATIVYIGMRITQLKARDTQRRLDITSITKGLVGYASEKDEQYPESLENGVPGAVEKLASKTLLCGNAAESSMAAILRLDGNMSEIPCDRFRESDNFYRYWSDGHDFIVEAALEAKSGFCYQGLSQGQNVFYREVTACLANGNDGSDDITQPIWKTTPKLRITWKNGSKEMFLKWQPGATASVDQSPITYHVKHTLPSGGTVQVDTTDEHYLLLIPFPDPGFHQFQVCAEAKDGSKPVPECISENYTF